MVMDLRMRGNQPLSNSDVNRLRVGLTLCSLLLLMLHCEVDGQSTANNGDRRISTTTSQSSVASDNIISQQLQDITNELNMLLGSMKKIDLIAVQQQEIVRDMQQMKQELVALKPNKSRSGGCTQPRDCYDLRSAGVDSSGIYTIFIEPTYGLLLPVFVYCDMETNGGGWTVFQRRRDGTVNFNRTWNEYAKGFGDLNGEFWLGNENLFAMTRNRRYKLRVELADFEGNKRFAEYTNFKVGSDSEKFKLLSIGNYSGDAGDSFTYHVGSKFSTPDQDNDSNSGHCSVQYKGAWWYKSCHYSHLNGYYYRGSHTTRDDGINWYHWKGHYYSLRFTEMKVRPT